MQKPYRRTVRAVKRGVKGSCMVMMNCNSNGCINAEDPIRIRSAKPEWHKLQARFIQKMEKEKERTSLPSSPSHYYCSSPLPSSPFRYPLSPKGERGFSRQLEIDPGSPDNYICRQRYLRSYQFTKEKKGVLEKSKSWFKEKKGEKGNNKGKGKGKLKEYSKNNKGKIEEFVGACLKFLLVCISNVDVHAENSVDSMFINFVPIATVGGR